MSVSREVDVAFLIADLSGYTALTEAHGDVSAARVVTRYVEVAQGVLEPGTRLVERVGDELLIVGPDAASIVRTAVQLRVAIEREPLFPTVRAGLHAGRVVEEGGAYFGAALNLAARVAAHARAREILCTEAVALRAGPLGDIEFRAVGPVGFRNIPDPVRIFEVIAGSERGDAPTEVDPVCRMQVRSDTAPARLPFGEKTYWFCSFECAKAFAQRPDSYAGL